MYSDGKNSVTIQSNTKLKIGGVTPTPRENDELSLAAVERDLVS